MKEKVRAGMVRQLRKNLARCSRVVIDQNMDLKTRERWTQLYNNTSQVLNQILKDSKSGAVAIQNLEQIQVPRIRVPLVIYEKCQ